MDEDPWRMGSTALRGRLAPMAVGFRVRRGLVLRALRGMAMSDPEIAAMRESNDRQNRATAARRLMLIEKANGMWSVEDDTSTGIAPQSEYPDATTAAARALQLLGIKAPVTPQDWPEEVCVGVIGHKGDPAQDPGWQA